MTVTQYITEKNRIIREALNIDFDLVPETQIKEVELTEPLSIISDVSACPYCHAYMLKESGCIGCPMEVAGNGCCHSDSTYEVITEKYVYNNPDTHATSLVNDERIRVPLEALIEQFNEEFTL